MQMESVNGSVRRRIVRHGPYTIRALSRGSPTGPHAVVLPGMAATVRAVAPQLRLLRSLGYTTHVIDLPGYGVGPPLRRDDASFPALARLVREAARALGVERALLLGHSLGGGLALHLALLDRAFVERLVLLAPAAVGRSLAWIYRLFCLPLIGRALLRPNRRGSHPYVRRFLVGSRRRSDRHFVEMLLRQEVHSPAKTRTTRAIVWANQPDARRDFLSALWPGREQAAFTLNRRLVELRHIPTLLLWGNEDGMICARDAAYLRAANPDAEIHIARGIGHMLTLEAAAWVNRHVARFAALPQAESSGAS